MLYIVEYQGDRNETYRLYRTRQAAVRSMEASMDSSHFALRTRVFEVGPEDLHVIDERGSMSEAIEGQDTLF